ncbi:MAG: AgmX/PglI C-terminal domain-containing protein [Myxococcales bacterium]|jgi:TonB family protein|nr:AgmX/PglI C-terminal domain-containing protein [Myxococcales bacterium]MBL0195389.1 AgmX/PglI C-terminal domain-containing protein [Myxococcales bacterium]HQY59952.1 AgmX/PglI C-terminal domain-containing protein [Polyangiaceae bacterium]
MTEPAVLRAQVLRVACVWGTTVLALRTLAGGRSFVFGEHRHASFPLPDGLAPSPTPIKAVDGGWVLDATGAVGGLLKLRGRAEDPVEIGRGGPVPIMPGDHGVLQYGQFGLFFQHVSVATPPPRSARIEGMAVFALVVSLLAHGASLGLASRAKPTRLPVGVAAEGEAWRRLGVLRALPAELPPPDRGGADDPAATAPPPSVVARFKQALGAIRPIPEELLAVTVKPAAPADAVAVAALDAGVRSDPLDAGARPDAALDAGAARGLPADKIRRTVVAHTASLRACYAAEALKTPGLKGDVVVQFRIEPSGQVGAASIVSSTLKSPSVEACLLRDVKTWTFPPAALPTEVAGYPLKFGG